MSRELFIELIVIIILSVITNIVIDRFRNWKNNRRTSGSENTPVGDSRSFRIRRNDTMNPPLPVRDTQTPRLSDTFSQMHNGAGGGVTPPALPHRQTHGSINIEDFPRCPIHKCCNRIGEAQKIFYDSNRKMWRCYHGHSFSS